MEEGCLGFVQFFGRRLFFVRRGVFFLGGGEEGGSFFFVFSVERRAERIFFWRGEDRVWGVFLERRRRRCLVALVSTGSAVQ